MKTKSTKRVLVILSTVLLAGVALAGCHEPTTDDQFTIGSVLPLTGDLSPFGPSAQNALNLAISHVNDAGGVMGEPVRHVEENSETRGEAALSAAGRLIDTERVHAIVGAMGSGVSMAFIDRVIDAQIPMVSPSNTNPDFTDYPDNGWYFRTVPSDAAQGVIMAYLLHSQNITDVSIIMLNNDYGVGFGNVVRETFEAQGGNVLEFVAYDPEGADFRADVAQAANAGPEGIVLIGYPDTGRIVLENAYEAGYLGGDSDIRWFFGEGMMDPGMVTEFHEDVEDGVLNGIWGTTPEELTQAGFIDDFQAAYGDDPALFSDRTYDAGMLLMLAAEHCQCFGGQALLDSMRAVQNSPGEEIVYDAARALELIRDGQDIVWTGAAGPMEWDDVGDVDAPYSTWRIADGQIVTDESGLWPEDVF